MAPESLALIMQNVLPAKNEDYVVPPLTTQATTIVSRTKTLIPVDNPGIYGHPGRGQSTISKTSQFTWGSNDNGCLTENICIIADFKPLWFDTTVMNLGAAALPIHMFPRLTPNFDQSQHALIRTLRFRLPNGTILEEFQNYNEWVNITDANIQNTQRKEFNLLNYSAFSKNPKKDKGLNAGLDGKWDVSLSSNSVGHGQTRRLVIPLTHSSFFQKYPFLPTMLLRNGVQLEIEWEDPNIAFCWESMSHLPSAHWYSHLDTLHPIEGTAQRTYKWLIAPGSIYNNGDAVAAEVVVQNAVSLAGLARTTPYLLTHWPGAASYAIDPIAPVNTHFGGQSYRYFKNTLYVGLDIWYKSFGPAISQVFKFGLFANGDNSQLRGVFPEGNLIGTPIAIYRRGKLVWRGFTLIDPFMAAGVRGVTPFGVDAAATPGAMAIYYNANVAANARFQTFHGSAAYGAQQSTYVGVVGDIGKNVMIGLPLYNWDHFDSSLQGGAPGRNTIPFGVFDVAADWQLFMEDFINMELELVIDVDQQFATNTRGGEQAIKGIGGSPTWQMDPRAALLGWWAGTGRNPILWSYTLANLQLYIDWIKPSAENTSKFINAYRAPTGIPYAFSRVFRVARNIQWPVTGYQSFVLNASYRSTLAVIMVLTDNFSGSSFAAGTTVNFFPSLSSFLRRGLSRMELQIGGVRKPEYTFVFAPDGGVEHIPETGNALGYSVSESLNPSFHRIELSANRNYAMAGNFDYGTTFLDQFVNNFTVPEPSEYTYAKSYGYEYSDSSKFIVAISIAKKDIANFACGTDTSTSGQLIANLYFNTSDAPTSQGDNYDPGNCLRRTVNATFYVVANGVCTLQNNSTTVRM